MKDRKIRSSLSYLVHTLRNSFSQRKNRSTIFLCLYSSLSYSHGSMRFFLGGTIGSCPNELQRNLVLSPSYALSIKMGTPEYLLPMFSIEILPCGASWQFPPDKCISTMILSFADTTWSLVFHPPFDLPIDCCPCFLKRHAHRGAACRKYYPKLELLPLSQWFFLAARHWKYAVLRRFRTIFWIFDTHCSICRTFLEVPSICTHFRRYTRWHW